MKYLSKIELDEGSNELLIFVSVDDRFFANDCEIEPETVEPLLIEALSADFTVLVKPLDGSTATDTVEFNLFYGDFRHNGRLIINMPRFLRTSVYLGRTIAFSYSEED
mgnify:CR=1 FL=1